MAHSCPDCGMLCYCGGDIDDCQFDGTPEQNQCGHCDDKEDEDPNDYDDDKTETHTDEVVVPSDEVVVPSDAQEEPRKLLE